MITPYGDWLYLHVNGDPDRERVISMKLVRRRRGGGVFWAFLLADAMGGIRSVTTDDRHVTLVECFGRDCYAPGCLLVCQQPVPSWAIDAEQSA